MRTRGPDQNIDITREEVGEERETPCLFVVPEGVEMPGESRIEDEAEATRIRAALQKPEKASLLLEGAVREISARDLPMVQDAVDRLKMVHVPLKSAVLVGNKTATEYDSQVVNYSTNTRIIELADGRKVFAVYAYKGSGVHRFLASLFMKKTGAHTAKASTAEWKQRFQEKSRITTIPYDDPYVVLMPYIPNINLFDLFTRSQKMKSFGECGFAAQMDEAKLLEIAGKIIDELVDVHDGGPSTRSGSTTGKPSHGKGRAWGEFILYNLIIDKDEKIHVCDPEVEYDEGMPLPEQKARDLFDIMFSLASAMKKSQETGYEKVVRTVLERYKDRDVLNELYVLLNKKKGLLEKIGFLYTKVRLQLHGGRKEYEAIRKIAVELMT